MRSLLRANRPLLVLLLCVCVIAVVGIPIAAVAQWGYNLSDGPANWCALDPSFQTCCRGVQQSPIDLTSASTARTSFLPPLVFDYAPGVLYVQNNGHTIQANTVPTRFYDPAVTIGPTRYSLVQFHLHTPSEHTLNGQSFPMELHFVHRDVDGHLAVVGVLVEQGIRNEEIDKILQRLPEHAGDTRIVTDFDVNKLLPAFKRKSFRYAGSLTTPPCTEGVRWTVMGRTITMSAAQIAVFRGMFSGEEFPDGNRRPVQSLGGRTVATEFVP
jgi:carbonic anhydrase